jgi:hypothetical protein
LPFEKGTSISVFSGILSQHFWYITSIMWFFFLIFSFLEGDDSNNEHPSLSSQEENAEDEPEGETDEQELGVYKLTFSIFLASNLM